MPGDSNMRLLGMDISPRRVERITQMKKTSGFRLILVSALLLVGSLSTAAQESRYFVALKQPTVGMASTQRSELQRNTESLMQFVQSSQFNGQMESHLARVNSLIIKTASAADLAALKASPAVEFIDREVFHKGPKPVAGFTATTQQYSPLRSFRSGLPTPWGIRAVRAMEAWNVSRSGLGARVLVLDTGIDKDHPSLAANFEAGRNFVSDNNSQVPYPFFDLGGHGTHVAGTVAASLDGSGFTGVAPQAKILMGRVCSEGCSNLAIAAGINWGVSQAVDVISMSLGGAFSTPAERRAIQAALSAGITVVAASGNGGTANVSYPAALAGVIAVGATDINNQKASFSQYGPELAVVAPGVDVMSTVPRGTGLESEVRIQVGQQAAQIVKSVTFQGSFAPAQPMINSLVPAGLGKPEDFAKVNVRGKYALVSRGEIMFAEKATNAVQAGAAGLIVYNNAPGLIRGSITSDGSTLPIPVFMVEQTVGETLLQVIASGREARASLVVVRTSYSSFDGTSMATPHVAGVIALIKATNKALTPAQVKQILMGTATPLGPNSNNELGAGLVNAQKAVEVALRAKAQQSRMPQFSQAQ